MEWKKYKLEELLSYEQPTPYIVESTDYDDSYSTPVLTAGKSFIIGYTNETSGIYNQLPVIIFDDFTTSTQYVNFHFKVKSSAMKILTANEELILPKFIYYRMQTIEFDHSTHKRYWIQQYSKIEVDVPPIDEQHRIVSRIEELFSELDNSVSTLQKTKEQLSVYRQAVLKEAFDSVKCVDEGARVKDVCNNIKVGIVIKPTQYYVESDGVKAFRNANVRRNYVDDDNWALISKEGHEKNKKSIVHTDDLVIARSGANLGMAAVVPEKCDGFNAIDIVIAELNLKVIDPHYLAYYVNSPYGLHVVNEYQHGGAQGHLNVKEFGLLPLILAPLAEQKSVVTEIESRLSVCDSIEQTVDIALQQAEAMRQSILKQAFEGRL